MYPNIFIMLISAVNTVRTVRRLGCCAAKKGFSQKHWSECATYFLSVCGFGGVTPERFAFSAFNCDGFPGLYILYRCMIALYQFVWTVLIVREWGNEPHYTPSDQKWKMLLFLSYWSYFGLTGYFMFATIAVSVYHYTSHNAANFSPDESEKTITIDEVITLNVVEEGDRNNINMNKGLTDKRDLPNYFSFMWFLQVIAYSTSVGATIVYWLQERPNHIFGAHVHGINTVLCSIDAIVIANPYRFCHVIYTSLFCLSYILFTVIFWTFGGLNHKGYRYIYKNHLDWENNISDSLLFTFFITFIIAPISNSFFWLLIKIKENVIQQWINE
ncbi:uncharacterized protein [Antedon mediterranea]|uniref:uncharacterized protein n=1 Tax=Antedon mediterranea TaxID=105859 RepID=UPI003AF50031